MSINEGICDWCGRERLMETGDEMSKIQFRKLWCGACRAGSKARYEGQSDEFLQSWIDNATEMLEQHPLQWEEPYDHSWMHLFKLDTSDEIYRKRNELEFRSERKDG